jgi:hypothetical protein
MFIVLNCNDTNTREIKDSQVTNIVTSFCCTIGYKDYYASNKNKNNKIKRKNTITSTNLYINPVVLHDIQFNQRQQSRAQQQHNPAQLQK